MGTTSKLFWFGLAAEILVTGVIGWKIAHARTHAWEVTPSPRRPNPVPLRAFDVRGQRQRADNPVSYRNAVAGSFDDEGVES